MTTPTPIISAVAAPAVRRGARTRHRGPEHDHRDQAQHRTGGGHRDLPAGRAEHDRPGGDRREHPADDHPGVGRPGRLRRDLAQRREGPHPRRPQRGTERGDERHEQPGRHRHQQRRRGDGEPFHRDPDPERREQQPEQRGEAEPAGEPGQGRGAADHQRLDAGERHDLAAAGAERAQQRRLAGPLRHRDGERVVDAERRDEQGHPAERAEHDPERLEEAVLHGGHALVDLGAVGDGLGPGGQHGADARGQRVLAHPTCGADRDAADTAGRLRDVPLRALQAERGERRLAERVLAAELADPDDRHGNALGREDGRPVADLQLSLVGEHLVDDDLVRCARRASLGEPVGVELRVVEPVPGGPRAAGRDGRPVFGEQLPGALDDGFGVRDAVHSAHLRQHRRVDLPARAPRRVAHLGGVADADVALAVGAGEVAVDAGRERVAEHQRAGEERHAEEHRDQRPGHAALAPPQLLEDEPGHDRSPSPRIRSRTRSAVGSSITSTTRPSARNTTASA
nr:hypothetical protein [Actinomadura montaniterrae]